MNAALISIYNFNTLSSERRSNGFIVWPLCGNKQPTHVLHTYIHMYVCSCDVLIFMYMPVHKTYIDNTLLCVDLCLCSLT